MWEIVWPLFYKIDVVNTPMHMHMQIDPSNPFGA